LRSAPGGKIDNFKWKFTDDTAVVPPMGAFFGGRCAVSADLFPAIKSLTSDENFADWLRGITKRMLPGC
jgi:hypothetical protein